MPYFDKNKDRRKNIVILGTEMLILFLQKNGIIIVQIKKKGSGELSFFYFSIKEVADAQDKSFNNNIRESEATVKLRMKKSFKKNNRR